MNQAQQNLENTYHRAGAPVSLLYEMIPVTDLSTGETTQELTRKRRPLDDITDEPDDERQDRVKKQKKSRVRKTKQEINSANRDLTGFLTSSAPSNRENKPESVSNVLRDVRDLLRPSTVFDPFFISRIERPLIEAGLTRPTTEQRERLRDEDVLRRAFQGTGLKGHKGINKGNPWMNHVRNFAKEHNLTYWEAMKNPRCKTSYRR